MQREFTVHPNYKIAYYLLSTAVVVISFFVAYNDFRFTTCFFSVIATIAGLSIPISVNRRKVIVSDDKITVIDFFNTHQINIINVKGYRRKRKDMIIEPNAINDLKIEINNYPDLFEDGDELIYYISSHFKDLDKKDL
ncbi:hypothetical protein FO440_10355 [Mucilaginibacter corticis]|uniref:Uncharacterized protein n=1 Tax=Mucilaginibacter corticis TaxID=2597670 RepID=A0A556MX94_9SPHI|nr:hypothetical protein [Mucilaginibacter corticis]TSJ44551.1 hypothetical protein FO440_10355 [Mucilaginibacter corticis]